MSFVNQYSPDELKKISKQFYHELVSSANNQPVSFEFTRHTIPSGSKFNLNKPIQVIIIGGTMITSVDVKITNGELVITNRKKEKIPVLKNKAVFLSLIDSVLNKNTEILCLNFGYSMVSASRENKIDGILLTGSKEHELTDLRGNHVGLTIEEYIRNKYHKSIDVVTANDSVCLALSALDVALWDSIVGGIVGTGTNFSFFLDKKNVVVDTNSAAFSTFPLTRTGKEIDRESSNPGEHLFEKEIAGAYLFKHYNFIVNAMIQSTEELSKIAETQSHEHSNIAQSLIERSASLIACQMAGIITFKKNQKINCLMDGSLFWRGFNYKTHLLHYLSILGVTDNIEFINVKNSGIIGALKLLTFTDHD